MTLEQSCKLLLTWSRTMANHAEKLLPDLQKYLDNSTELPVNCPSHASLGAMRFGEIEHDFEEITNAMKLIKECIASTT